MKLSNLYIKTETDNETYFCFMSPAKVSLSYSLQSLSRYISGHTSGFRSLLSFFISLLISLSLFGQNDSISNNYTQSEDIIDYTTPLKKDSALLPFFETNKNYYTLTPKQKNTRQWLVGTTNVVGYGGVLAVLASAWYTDYTKTGLHSFNDSREWLQVDKTGHFYGTYIESRASNELWRWAGMGRKKRIWISGLTSFAFQTTIEYLDGKSEEWGWSWSDCAANVLGSGSFIAQELAWDEQRIKFKWSFHRKSYSDPQLNQRSDELFGESTPERILKDYNGQTYWASANLKSFFPKSNLPSWLSVAVGYGAEGMFGGEENIARDENDNIIFDRTDIKRRRQWYLSPDIDFTKIKTKKKAVKFLFSVLSAFKFPAPALQFSNGKFKAHFLYF